jgi:hypothetical protein
VVLAVALVVGLAVALVVALAVALAAALAAAAMVVLNAARRRRSTVWLPWRSGAQLPWVLLPARWFRRRLLPHLA